MTKNIKMNKQAMTTESGRSMVEMLGVLAVIGVLSIGGIAGYTYAMNKSKANDILDGVSQRALIVSQQMILGNTDGNVLVEYKNKKIGDYTVDGGVYEGNEFMWIEVSGVEGPVCERIVDMDWKMPSGFTVNEKEAVAASCKEEGNTLTFDFSATLNDGVMSENGKESKCLPSEKRMETYTGGPCCNMQMTGMFCPDETPPTTCTKSPTCNVTSEDDCDELGGDWKCSDDGESECICVGKNEKGLCNYYNCTKCDKTYNIKIPGFSGVGICFDSDETGDCGEYDCIKCPDPDLVEDCSSYNCSCVCENSNSRQVCNSSSSKCVCVDESTGETGACGDNNCVKCTSVEGLAECVGDNCSCLNCATTLSEKCCDASNGIWKTTWDEDNVAICVDESTEIGECNRSNCQKCPKTKQLGIPEDNGAGICYDRNAGERVSCNYNTCWICYNGLTPMTPSYGNTGICVDESIETGACTSGYASECIKCTPDKGTATCDDNTCTCQK